MKKIILAATAAVLLSVSACGNYTEPYKDADRGNVDKSPGDILLMPNGFSNVAVKCDGSTRVYTIYHGDNAYGAVAAVPNSPECS